MLQCKEVAVVRVEDKIYAMELLRELVARYNSSKGA
jgi:hypothetical protein